jgi:hypothetical protein
MNSKFHSANHPRFSSTGASFKTGRVSPDIICRMYGQLSFSSGSHEMMLGLEMVTDALVFMVMRQVMSPLQPLVFRLTLLLLANTLSVKLGDEINGASAPSPSPSSCFFFFTHFLSPHLPAVSQRCPPSWHC